MNVVEKVNKVIAEFVIAMNDDSIETTMIGNKTLCVSVHKEIIAVVSPKHVWFRTGAFYQRRHSVLELIFGIAKNNVQITDVALLELTQTATQQKVKLKPQHFYRLPNACKTVNLKNIMCSDVIVRRNYTEKQ